MTSKAYAFALALTFICATAMAHDCPECKCPPETSVGIKWHPGHYMLTDPNISVDKQIAHIAELTGNKNIRGVQVRIYWGEMEVAKNQYDWRVVDQLLSAAKAANKQLVLQIMDRKFHTTSTTIRGGNSSYKAYPQYLMDEGHIYRGTFAGKGSISMLWKAPAMDRYIALHQAILAKYDNEPNLEMLCTEEVNPGLSGGTAPADSGYNNPAYGTQWKRMMTAVSSKRKRTGLCIYTNSLAGQLDRSTGIIEHARREGWAVGGPDVIPNNPVPGDNVIVGNKESPDNTPGGYQDVRGKTAIAYAVQSPELGGKEGTFTPEQLTARAKYLGANYLFWVRITWNPGNATSRQMWPTGILPYINANPNTLRSTCPANYAALGGCDTR